MDNLGAMFYTESRTVHLSDVYNLDQMREAINGYDAERFDLPKYGELFLSTDLNIHTSSENWSHDPRLILRKKTKKRYLVTRLEIIPDESTPRRGCILESTANMYNGLTGPRIYSIVEEEC